MHTHNAHTYKTQKKYLKKKKQTKENSEMHVIKDRDESYKPREKLWQIRGRNETGVTYFFLAVRSEMHTSYTLILYLLVDADDNPRCSKKQHFNTRTIAIHSILHQIAKDLKPGEEELERQKETTRESTCVRRSKRSDQSTETKKKGVRIPPKSKPNKNAMETNEASHETSRLLLSLSL